MRQVSDCMVSMVLFMASGDNRRGDTSLLFPTLEWASWHGVSSISNVSL